MADASAHEAGQEPGTDRLLALSDGVVAIALTLLVLQLEVPVKTAVTATSGRALYDQLTG
jgi:uncharacterized membrane protein